MLNSAAVAGYGVHIVGGCGVQWCAVSGELSYCRWLRCYYCWELRCTELLPLWITVLVVGVYVLATTKVISGRVLTCDSAHAW